MRIYIAGPMHGMPGFNEPAFFAAQVALNNKGHHAENPFVIGAQFAPQAEIDKSFASLRKWEEVCPMADRRYGEAKRNFKDCALAFRVRDYELATVRSCDAIYLLNGWRKSVGAKSELLEALRNGLEIFIEGEDDVPAA